MCSDRPAICHRPVRQIEDRKKTAARRTGFVFHLVQLDEQDVSIGRAVISKRALEIRSVKGQGTAEESPLGAWGNRHFDGVCVQLRRSYCVIYGVHKKRNRNHSPGNKNDLFWLVFSGIIKHSL